MAMVSCTFSISGARATGKETYLIGKRASSVTVDRTSGARAVKEDMAAAAEEGLSKKKKKKKKDKDKARAEAPRSPPPSLSGCATCPSQTANDVLNPFLR